MIAPTCKEREKRRMISLKKASETIRTHIGDDFVITSVSDLGDAFLFGYRLKKYPDEAITGAPGYTVDKKSGDVEEFYLPDEKNFERLAKAVEIPREQWGAV